MNIYNFLNNNHSKLPTVEIYSEILCLSCRKFGITQSEARNRYGLYNCKQWIDLLELN